MPGTALSNAGDRSTQTRIGAEMKKEICLECDGNGYVADSDGEQRVYRDCDRCDSEGEVAVAEADPSV